MNVDYSVNVNIRNLIEDSGKQAFIVADKAGIKRDVFIQIINNRRPVYAEELLSISAALCCSVNVFFE